MRHRWVAPEGATHFISGFLPVKLGLAQIPDEFMMRRLPYPLLGETWL
jgi:hypothetical protein